MRSKQQFAIGLVLVGLGVPRLVDAVEIAYRLDIRRDVGVLPWYIVTALGVALLVWHSFRSRRPESDRRIWFPAVLWSLAVGFTTVLVASVGVLLLGRNLVEQILASGEATMWLAIRGLVLFAMGVGVLIYSACFSGGRAGRVRTDVARPTRES